MSDFSLWPVDITPEEENALYDVMNKIAARGMPVTINLGVGSIEFTPSSLCLQDKPKKKRDWCLTGLDKSRYQMEEEE